MLIDLLSTSNISMSVGGAEGAACDYEGCSKRDILYITIKKHVIKRC